MISLSIRPPQGARVEEILDGGWGRGRRERKGVSLRQPSLFFAFILALFPQKRLILRLTNDPLISVTNMSDIMI